MLQLTPCTFPSSLVVLALLSRPRRTRCDSIQQIQQVQFCFISVPDPRLRITGILRLSCTYQVSLGNGGLVFALQTIIFDDFQIWEGWCAPAKEPFSQTIVKPVPKWEGMREG